MLIGVDDTGTVVDGERFIVAVVLIRPSSLARVTSDLTRWEELTRRGLPNRPREVKSSHLDEAARRSFVNDVLGSNATRAFYFGIGIDVDAHVLAWGERQRDRHIAQLRAAVDTARREGRSRFANQVNTMAGWLRKTPSGMFIKMLVLNAAVARSINQAIGASVALAFDSELGALRYSIDVGFTRGGFAFWQDVLRSYLMTATQQEPIIQIDTWTQDHPFVSTFIEEGVGPFLRLTPEFKNRIGFYDSSQSVEIRMADQVAGLLRHKYIAGAQAAYLERMKTECALRPEITVLQFGDLDAFETASPELNLYDEVKRLREQGSD